MPIRLCQHRDIHLPECYSDINADIETQSQWEETISGVLEGACPQENILAVASSQLGYTESEKNFELDENGVVGPILWRKVVELSKRK